MVRSNKVALVMDKKYGGHRRRNRMFGLRNENILRETSDVEQRNECRVDMTQDLDLLIPIATDARPARPATTPPTIAMPTRPSANKEIKRTVIK